VKHVKSDAVDVAAICKVVMCFVAIKAGVWRGTLILNPARDLIVRQRIKPGNPLRGLLGAMNSQSTVRAIKVPRGVFDADTAGILEVSIAVLAYLRNQHVGYKNKLSDSS
jgi:hypothetical protein